MSANNLFKTDLFRLHNIVQSSMIVYPKEEIIATLRDFFSKDTYYHYVKDQWGFAKTTDHTDLEPGAGLIDNITTRIFIGENYRYDGIYYPAILVKNNGSKYVPISINREQTSVKYENTVYQDGYNEVTISKPKYFITAGIWEGSISIDVITRSLRARDDIVELIGMCFSELYFNALADVGIVVKPIVIGSPSETDDRSDKLFKQTLTMDVRTEWRREIPIANIIETIVFSIEFGDPIVAPNLTIQTEIKLDDIF